MRSIAAAFFAIALPLAARAQCTSSADVPVSPVRFVPTCGHSSARIAATGEGALSVWSSVHHGFSMTTYWTSGTVLDSAGTPLRSAEHVYQYGSTSAELATDGRDNLMVFPTPNGAWARAITASGEATGDEVQIVSNPTGPVTLRVVWNGDAYAVAASDAVKTTVTLVSTDAKVVDSAAIATDASIAALTQAGRGRVLALLRTQTGIESVLVTGVTPASRIALPIPSTAIDVAVAASGSGFLAVSRDSGRIAALPLDAGGAPSGAPVLIASNASDGGISVVWERDRYLVLWSGNGVEAARVGGGGAVWPRFFLMDGVLASAAFNGSGTIVLSVVGCGSVASAFLPRGAESSAEARDVSLAAVAQGSPQIVVTPAGHQLFWTESAALLTAFVAADGTIGPVKRIGASIGRSVALRAADSTLAIWSDFPGGQLPGTLRVSRFDARGNETDSRTITDAWFLFGLAAASNGSEVVVTWTQQEPTGAKLEVYAARISAAGDILVAPALLSIPSDDMYEVVIGADGEKAIIGWRNGANTLVAVEAGARLEIVSRHELPVPSSPVVFPIAAAIHDGRSIVAWWAADDSNLRLHATDVESGADAVLRRDLGPIRDVRILPRGDGWLFYVSDYEFPATDVRRTLLHDGAFGEDEMLLCTPGAAAFTLSGDRIDAAVFSAPVTELEGASRLYFRNLPPPRRRATR